MNRLTEFSLRTLLASAWLALPLAVLAHEGHDDAPAAPVGAAAPRFATSSEQFELVGVLQGQHLALYLDRSDSNQPVADAKIELELGGKTLAVTAVAPGQYQADLPAPLPEGETPITATIVAAEASDLLAAALDVHLPAAAQAAQAVGAPAWRNGAIGGLAVLTMGAGLWAARRRGRAQTGAASRQGGAA